jgi:hypothetical protein
MNKVSQSTRKKSSSSASTHPSWDNSSRLIGLADFLLPSPEIESELGKRHVFVFLGSTLATTVFGRRSERQGWRRLSAAGSHPDNDKLGCPYKIYRYTFCDYTRVGVIHRSTFLDHPASHPSHPPAFLLTPLLFTTAPVAAEREDLERHQSAHFLRKKTHQFSSPFCLYLLASVIFN